MKKLLMFSVALLVSLLVVNACSAESVYERLKRQKASGGTMTVTKDELESTKAAVEAEDPDMAAIVSKVNSLKAAGDTAGLRAMTEKTGADADSAKGKKIYSFRLRKASVALFDLGDFDFLAQRVIYRGDTAFIANDEGYRVLQDIGSRAIPEVVKFLGKSDFSFSNAGPAMEKLVEFLSKNDALSANIASVAKFTAATYPETVRIAAARGCGLAKYKAAEPNIRPLLANSNPNNRKMICWVLGEIGSSASLGALQSLAANDPTFNVVEKDGYAWKEFWVRDAAKEAISKIQAAN